jgi:asparagine synthase (glutamine-hydrolysing)
MCGITGIINKKDIDIDAFKLQWMNDQIIHRGPDSYGFYTKGKVGFGHRRLSILDLSPLGHQPMEYKGKYVITFNGEIYNYLEIKEELIKAGYNFLSGTDTEVILAAYDYWKEDCLQKFNGMWAFAIHDIYDNKVFISRDRFGVKPIYYSDNDLSFSFGSEIKQLLNPDGENYLNENVLLESMLTHIDNHTIETYFDGVYSFPASHYMYYDLTSNAKVVKKYYELKVNQVIKNSNASILQNNFDATLKSAIDIRLRSDVKVGTCLSGGLDSSSISMLASKSYKFDGQKFVAVNAKSIDSSNDESEFAELVAREADLDLNIVMPSYEDFVNTIDEVIYTQEEPFGSPSMFMGWHVFQKAKSLNCTVMLNGQGGDEILLGYERYFASTINFWNPIQAFRNIYNQYNNSRLTLKNTFLYAIYFKFASFRIKRLTQKSLLKKEYIKDKYFSIIEESAKNFGNVDNLQINEITKVQLPHLLRYEDRNSMRHSIETRLPFLDYRLVELAISLPVSLKIKNGWTKYILRKSVDNILPKKIVWRKNKFGFEAPDKIWINKYNEQMIKQVTKSSILAKYCEMDKLIKTFKDLSLKDRWMYFNIARWEKVYKVKVVTK